MGLLDPSHLPVVLITLSLDSTSNYKFSYAMGETNLQNNKGLVAHMDGRPRRPDEAKVSKESGF